MNDVLDHKGEPTSSLYVVGIGASAGGLEAIEELFSNTPLQTGVAYVVIQHLSPDHKSLMDELLARKTNIPVIVAENGMKVQADKIYLLPTNQEMIISNDHLFLSEREKSDLVSHPINTFLRSLADCCQHRSVAVILSGAGTDGSVGAQAVHDAGGLVIAQDPQTCRFGDMPRNAIATKRVDLVLPASEMPTSIVRYSKTTARVQEHIEIGEMDLDEKRFSEIILLLKNRFDLDFSQYKPSTITRRLDRRLAAQQSNKLEDYLEVLLSQEEELQALYFDLLIGVTHFFRDRKYFEKVEEALPRLFSDFSDDPTIRLWVAGCATGQEAYSLAILLHEFVTKHGIDKPWKIFATDIHRTSITKGATGVFSLREMDGLNEEQIDTYFSKVSEDTYQVKAEIRKTVVFSPHNVIKDPPFTKMHMVSCRNLLIYLNQAAQNQVLSLLTFALRLNGLLFLGPSESIQKLASSYSTVDQVGKIYRKSGERHQRPILNMELSTRHPQTLPVQPSSAESPAVSVRAKKALEQLLMEYVPPSVMTDLEGNVLRVFGSAKDFLSVDVGVPSLNIRSMVGYPAKTVIAQMLSRVRRSRQPVVSKGVQGFSEQSHVDIEVRPLSQTTGDLEYALLTFTERRRVNPEMVVEEAVVAEVELPDRLVELEEELLFTKESLQATVEELETSNEELQATNEELMASNEELQSTNEELQSVNEELYTVNSEYQAKEKERVELETDQRNILDVVGVAVLILDETLRVRKFSPLASEVFGLLPGDEGRPFSALSIPSRERLLPMVVGACEREQIFEEEIEGITESVYAARVCPYVSLAMGDAPGDEMGRNGVVISLADISSRTRAEDSLKQADVRYQAVLDSISDGFFEWDREADVLFLPVKLRQILGYASNDPLNWQQLLREQAAVFTEEISCISSNFLLPVKLYGNEGKSIWMLCKGEIQGSKVVGVFVDISLLKSKERALEESNLELFRSNQLLEDFAFVVSHDLKAPLRHTLYYVDYLKEALDQGDTQQAREEVESIESSARRLDSLIDDLITLARISSEARHQVPVDLNDVLDSVLLTLQPGIDEAKLEVHRDPLPTVMGNSNLLEQLFQNLISNACKYNDKEKPQLSIRGGRSEGGLVVEFADNGIGLPPSQREHIFLPFKRLVTSDKISGTGIGLAICKTVVEHHRGVIEVEGREGEGATFRITLPLQEDSSEC